MIWSVGHSRAKPGVPFRVPPEWQVAATPFARRTGPRFPP